MHDFHLHFNSLNVTSSHWRITFECAVRTLDFDSAMINDLQTHVPNSTSRAHSA